jgi:hypothetical protein
MSEDLDRWMYREERRQSTSGQRLRAAHIRSGFSIDEMVPANGNKPITSLRGAARSFVSQLKAAVGEAA